MSVLDKNYGPDLRYTDMYAHGSVYFKITEINYDRSSETPFIKEVYGRPEEVCIPLSLLSIRLDECPTEVFIATCLTQLFNTDAIVVMKSTSYPSPILNGGNNETYVAIVGNGQYHEHPITTCKIVLKRNPSLAKSSPST